MKLNLDFLENIKTNSEIEYYENKISQWDLLDSFGEDWEDSDITQRGEWVDRIKGLKESLIK